MKMSVINRVAGTTTKNLLACALTYSLSSGAVQAQWIMSLDLGGSNSRIHTSDLSDQISEGNIVDIDDSDFSWQVSFGYRLDQKLSVRVGYLDLGQGSLVIEGDTVTPDEVHQQVSEIMPLLASGVTFGIQYQLFRHEQFSVDLDLGGFRWESKLTSQLDGETIRNDAQDVDFYYGLKTYYHIPSGKNEPDSINSNWSLYLSYNAYRLPSNDIDNWSLGLEYSF